MVITELAYLQAECYEKFFAFQKMLQAHIDEKIFEPDYPEFDFVEDIKYLDENTQEGIAFKKAVDELNQYRKNNP